MVSNPSAGNCLPTVRELSRRFGISLFSVRKRLRPYIADGTLTAVRGRGTFVTARMRKPEQPAGLRTVSSAASIADAVAEDIASGKLKYGEPLPAVKLVRNQFRTAHINVTHAYRILARRGLARKVGRNYWVGGMKSIRSFGARGTIVCFNFSEGDSSDFAAGKETYPAFASMEHELHRHRLSIRFEDPAGIDLALRPGAAAQSDYAGILISGITRTRYADLQSRVECILPVLSQSGKRMLLCGGHPHRRCKTHYFCHGTIITNVVRTAADYSFSKGFRDIVLVFRESGDNVSDVRFLLRFISESLLRNPDARIRFLIQPLSPGQSPQEVFKRTPSFRNFGNFEYLEGLLSKYRPITMDDLCKLVVLGDNIEDLFLQAPRESVWICRDASTANRIVRWCTTNRIPLPSGTAVLCFDESPALAVRGVATCVPDWPTIGYLMAHALIGDIPVKKSRRGFLHTPALLYERRTMP